MAWPEFIMTNRRMPNLLRRIPMFECFKPVDMPMSDFAPKIHRAHVRVGRQF